MSLQGMGPVSSVLNRMQAAMDEVGKTAASAVSVSESAKEASEIARRSITELLEERKTTTSGSDIETAEMRAILIRLEDSVAQAREESRRANSTVSSIEAEVQAVHKLAKEAKTESTTAHKLAKDAKASQGKLVTEVERLSALVATKYYSEER